MSLVISYQCSVTNIGLIFGQCTVTCDSGIITRQVICVNYHQQINENYCDPEGRPSKEQECNMPPCPAVYHTPKIHEHPSHFPEAGYPPIHHPLDNTNQWNHPSVGGYQWRTGPWGAVRKLCFSILIYLTCVYTFVEMLSQCRVGEMWHYEKYIQFKIWLLCNFNFQILLLNNSHLQISSFEC